MRKLLDELINIKQWEKSLSYKLSKEKLKDVIETIQIKASSPKLCVLGVIILYIFIPLCFDLSSAKTGRNSIKLYYWESNF